MNTKLTEKEYQHMIIELITQSISNFDDLKTSGNEDHTDWIYFIERLKMKGVKSDMAVVSQNVQGKSKHVARVIRRKFDNDKDYTITTII